MANTLTIDQASTLFNAILAQSKGGAVLATVNTKDFVTLAQHAINVVGYDDLLTAMSKVISRSIFSVRPYTRKLQFLQNDTVEFGAFDRKLSAIDPVLRDNDALKVINGQSIDPYLVEKPQVYQANFYGAETFEVLQTIYKQQLKPALLNEGEWAQYLTMVLTAMQNVVEKTYEDTARMTVVNLIAGTMSTGVASQQVHLLTEYNSLTGQSLTLAQAMAPAAFPDFARWIFSRITSLSKALREYSYLYHVNPTAATPIGGNISRHSDTDEQRLVLYEPFFQRVASNVLSVSFNDRYLQLLPYEGVTFWQNPLNPQSIDVDAGYVDSAGAVQHAAVSSNVVLGILFDQDAAGTVLLQDDSYTSPFNIRGEYWNVVTKGIKRYYNDNTENAVVLLLD